MRVFVTGATGFIGSIGPGRSATKTFQVGKITAMDDKRAIEVLGSVLEGSKRPLLVTSGLATVGRGGSPQRTMLLSLLRPRIPAPRKRRLRRWPSVACAHRSCAFPRFMTPSNRASSLT